MRIVKQKYAYKVGGKTLSFDIPTLWKVINVPFTIKSLMKRGTANYQNGVIKIINELVDHIIKLCLLQLSSLIQPCIAMHVCAHNTTQFQFRLHTTYIRCKQNEVLCNVTHPLT